MKATAIIDTLDKRRLIIHDGLALAVLVASSVVLFGLTLFMFRSFESHRATLATRWSQRGKVALQQGRPEQAVSAFRTSLGYAPDQRDDQLMLAQALAAAGYSEEATNYFLALWDSRPGDGFINLELARLTRSKGNMRQATDYYRAAIFGSWQGDGVVRRRQVRLELIDLLIQQRQFSEARNELFIVAGNASNDVDLDLTVAQKLELAGYQADSLSFYKKALLVDAKNRLALEHAGRISYAEGDYPDAQKFLQMAIEQKPLPGEKSSVQPELISLSSNAARIQELSLSRDQQSHVRANHILAATKIAHDRLLSCEISITSLNPDEKSLEPLSASWASAMKSPARFRTLVNDIDAQDFWSRLVFQTEQETARLCGVPTGDDALLLHLSESAQGKDRSSKEQVINVRQ